MTQEQKDRVFNFSAGPATLPLPALERAREELLCFDGAGASVMEISHRSKEFAAVHENAKDNIRKLLKVPNHYHILFLQGGASLQFSMAPMNLMRGTGKPADYIITGSWGNKAVKQAQTEGEASIVWDGKQDNYVRTPAQTELKLNPGAAFVHFTSNETIQGVQFASEPDTADVPLVCDASSDILSRPIPVENYGIIYAGAQKNIGPSGVAVVIIRDDLLEHVPDGLPALMDYKVLAEADSLYNTPPTFAVYMISLVTDWLVDTAGSLEKMAEVNEAKAQALYSTIDNSDGFYRGHAEPASRSRMNVAWRLPSEEQEKDFLALAEKEGLVALKGHRSVGGIRASIYNAMPAEGVEALCGFMREYQRTKG
jgi:phosphoserine aminotransferase